MLWSKMLKITSIPVQNTMQAKIVFWKYQQLQ